MIFFVDTQFFCFINNEYLYIVLNNMPCIKTIPDSCIQRSEGLRGRRRPHLGCRGRSRSRAGTGAGTGSPTKGGSSFLCQSRGNISPYVRRRGDAH